MPQSCCSACRARRELHLSVAVGNFRISTFDAEITPGEGPTSERRRRAQPPVPGLARQERRARRVWTRCGTVLRMLRPTALSSRGPDLRQKGARGLLTRRPLSEAGNSICPKLRSCQGMWARGGNPRLPAASELARLGNQPQNSLR